MSSKLKPIVQYFFICNDDHYVVVGWLVSQFLGFSPLKNWRNEKWSTFLSGFDFFPFIYLAISWVFYFNKTIWLLRYRK
jgi:hypothetical protein